MSTLTTVVPIAKEGGGSFLVSPSGGLMIWTLICLGISFLILRKLAFPAIGEALDKRANAIADSLDHAAKTREEADELLEEYRARLKEAREQADDIVVRARQNSDKLLEESKSQAKEQREELLEATRREIEDETKRALEEIRKEVANLTVIATEKVTRKSLDSSDHKRLIDEALAEVDFSALGGSRN